MPRPAGRPRLWLVGAVLAGLLAVGGVAVLRDGSTVVTPGDRATSGPAVPSAGATAADREDQAARLLVDLAAAVRAGDTEAAAALAGARPAAAAAVARLVDNVRALRLDRLTFRYVDDRSGAVDRATLAAYGPGAWPVDVEVEWRIAGFDERTSRTEVTFVFVDARDGVRLAATGGPPGRRPATGAAGLGVGDTAVRAGTPLWLLDDLVVRHGARWLVVATRADLADQHAALAARAVRDVGRVLPGWDGRLVVQVPADEQQMHQVLGAAAGTYEAIAAVTATADGSDDAAAPVHVVVNPEVFAQLGEAGAQVVMSHEAAHVATDAATADVPVWLLEGFADYVALAHVDLPVSTTAGQALAAVRRDGPPPTLPTSADFDPAGHGLGASYEAAWLAAWLLADRYGEDRLVAFYDAVDAGLPVGDAFRSVLGTTEAAFTRQWQAHLRELAR